MLEKIYIENFLSLVNKQELKIANSVTTLIGENAVGKTSVLKAINKLNGESIDVKEKNINHQDKPTCISAEIRISITDQDKINNDSNNKFILYPKKNDIIYNLSLDEKSGELYYSLYDKKTKIDLVELSIPDIKKYFNNQLKNQQVDNNIKNKIIDKISNKDTVSKVLEELTEEEKASVPDNINEDLSKLSTEIGEISNKLIPTYNFIYMNSFKDVLVDEILIDDIDNNQTVLNFLNIVGIKKDEIIDAVDHDKQDIIDEMQAKAVDVITEDFKKIFSQIKDDDCFKISININAKNRKLYFWVKNKNTGYKPLLFSDQSEGMQWYLSIYLKLYEYFCKNEDNTKYILLLDEPNVYLHAAAQHDLLENVFKEKLHDTQIIYTTHSPYMIDAKDLFSLRIIDKDTETKIYNATNKYKKQNKQNKQEMDVLTPVLTAIGIDISNQLRFLPNDKIIVVEGKGDYYALHAMLKKINKATEEYKIIPCMGASKSCDVCSYLFGMGYKNIIALFDNDKAGRDGAKGLDNFIKVLYYNEKEQPEYDKNFVLEDLFAKEDLDKYGIKHTDIPSYRKMFIDIDKNNFNEATIKSFTSLFDKIEEIFNNIN